VDGEPDESAVGAVVVENFPGSVDEVAEHDVVLCGPGRFGHAPVPDGLDDGARLEVGAEPVGPSGECFAAVVAEQVDDVAAVAVAHRTNARARRRRGTA
jgi:hypothetical protein